MNQTIDVPIKKLVPTYDDDVENAEHPNPNRMTAEEYAALVLAIKTHGFLQPLLVHKKGRGNYQVIDGHHRLRAAQEAGLQQLPVLVTSHSAAARGIAIGMNHIRGELDLQLATAELRNLQLNTSWGAEALAAMSGFSVEDINALVLAPEDEVLELEEMPAPSAPRAEKGEYVLELNFTSKEDYQLARKRLRRAAGGGGDLSVGLLALIHNEKNGDA